MNESVFSSLFIKMLKQLDKNIKNINGVDCYSIPVKTINQLKNAFYSDNIADNKNNIEDDNTNYNVEYFTPIF